MSAVPDDEGERNESPHPLQRHWHWIALALLAFCWVAEASMCAARGF